MNVKNKKCIRHLSFKSLWASRKRNTIAIIAIALTTLLFTSLFTIVMSINASYESYTFRQIGGYSHGTFKEVNQKQIEEFSNHKKVKAVGERTAIGFLQDGVFAKVPAEISYMDKNCSTWSYCDPSKGRLPEKENEIAMDTTALELLGIEPELGAMITLDYKLSDKNQMGAVNTGVFTLVGYWEYDELIPVHYINISKDYVQDVEKIAMELGMEPFRTDLNVMLASSVNIRGVMEHIDTDLGYQWDNLGADNCVRIGVNWGYTTSELGAKIDPELIVAMVVFIVLVFFTGYLIIYNIFQISVTGDIRFYGLLKTIGVTPRQLRRMIRHMALLLCILGIPIGLLCGYGIGAGLTPIIIEQTSLGTTSSTLSMSPFIFLGATLFSLITVLLSCNKPGKIAAKVSPVEATKYTENNQNKRKHRRIRGARIHQMAFANLGRNRLKTTLVVLSLSLAVVLFNILIIFVSGFDMDKYLEAQTCGDFIVGTTEYFRYAGESDNAKLDDEVVKEIQSNTSASLEGKGYVLSSARPQSWIAEEKIRNQMSKYYQGEQLENTIQALERRGDSVCVNLLLEGLDPELFEKLTVVDGDLTSLLDPKKNTIAIRVELDDYGNIVEGDYPKVGDVIPVTYLNDFNYIDSRTGELCDETTPEEFLKLNIIDSVEAEYTVCAQVILPFSMSFRFQSAIGYDAILPIEKLEADSGMDANALFYLFDTENGEMEEQAESYLSKLTESNLSPIMYESKATVRESFEGFQKMFVLLGGLLCLVIGVVGILNFFNAMMTAILSRRREFAVLQAIGQTRKQLKAMLIWEGVFYALGAAVFSIALSLSITPLVGKLLEGMFWFYTYAFVIWPVLVASVVFIFLGILIPLIMYSSVAKESAVERLREAE